MIGSKKATWVLASFAIVTLIATTASAGVLGTGLSYADATKPAGWEGTKHFSQAVTGGLLAGDLDWAVFTASNFNSLFTGDNGYTPTPGELVYTYWLHNTGTVNMSIGELLLLGSAPADDVGSFSGNGVSGQAPGQMSVVPTEVLWDYSGVNNIVHPGTSEGMAVCSIRTPRSDYFVVVDGGTGATITGIAGPGATAIPEPSVLALLAVAAAMMGVVGIRRK
jgi:hypothetical protein